VPTDVKREVTERAGQLLAEMRPRYIKAPPKNPVSNYPIDLCSKWRGSFFYLGATFASPGPNALSPTFELPFARMEYTPDGKFNLAYHRHTGQFWQIKSGLTLQECLKCIDEDLLFTAVLI
jgi:hypothetical protein